jgi:hypothetical protein
MNMPFFNQAWQVGVGRRWAARGNEKERCRTLILGEFVAKVNVNRRKE